MSNKYIVSITEENCVEISKPNSSILVYKIPYYILKNNILNIDMPNRFVVYILLGKNEHKQDIVYVGKSKNGLDNRPISHEGENKFWETCYILTAFNERTYLNDGTILYIENQIHQRVKSISRFNNTTKTTTFETVNSLDKEFCDEYIDEAYKMLYILGLDLSSAPKTESQETPAEYLPQEIEDIFKNIESVFQ